MSSIYGFGETFKSDSPKRKRHFCGDRDSCIAFDPESPECQKDNGCMTEENVKAYLEWCRRAIECDLKKEVSE